VLSDAGELNHQAVYIGMSNRTIGAEGIFYPKFTIDRGASKKAAEKQNITATPKPHEESILPTRF
jgi:hypothetical protein